MCLVVCMAMRAATPALGQILGPVITSPTRDQALQGQVAITGTADGPAFARAELAFAYFSDTTNSWFTIQTFSQPVDNSVLATWNTAAITDGEYVVRLRVVSQDGTIQDAAVAIQVRNYTAPLSVKPTASAPGLHTLQVPTPVPSRPVATAVPTSAETPSPLPPNPAALNAASVYAGFWRGALLVVGLFLVLGLGLLRRSR